jgi:hypothetical protein
MAIIHESNQYQIPRGRVLFDPVNPNTGALTGEAEFGNCPGFTVSIESEKADHYSSETGLRQKDASVTVEVNRTATITCDNVSVENLARFLSGTVETITQTSGTVADEEITVLKGRHYQLGRSDTDPAGARNITAVVVTSDDTVPVTYVANTDYAVDLELGRLQILAGGAIDNSELIHIAYSRPAKTWKRIKTGAATELAGAIRVISDNASGEDRDFYMPKVNLTPNGELPVIAEGTDFVTMEFSCEILKPANGEAIYVDGRPVA